MLSLSLVLLVEYLAQGMPFRRLVATGMVRIIDMLLIGSIFYFSENTIAPLGLSRSRMKHGIIRGILWSFCFGIIAGIMFLGLMMAGINPVPLIHIRLPDRFFDIMIFYGVAGLIGPVAEEIFFRGMIYGYVRKLFSSPQESTGIFFATAISTALFVAAHFSQWDAAVLQCVGGIVFCAAYEKEKSLMTPIVIHCSGNMALFTVSLLS